MTVDFDALRDLFLAAAAYTPFEARGRPANLYEATGLTAATAGQRA